MIILTTQFSLPETTNVVDDFEFTILECLCLSLPRSSKSPELVQLLRRYALQLGPPNDKYPTEREETIRASLRYIEVSSNGPRPFYPVLDSLSDFVQRYEASSGRSHQDYDDERSRTKSKERQSLRHRLHRLKTLIFC
jgi:hypothetical protein